MPRTILYSRTLPLAEAPEAINPRYSGLPIGDASDEMIEREGDDFAGKLVKYIPGEALALVALISSIAGITEKQILAIVAVGGVGQLLWLHRAAGDLAAADRPSWRQYIFALVAYLGWILGTTPAVCSVVGVARTTGAICMASVAYLLPLIDDAAHRRLDPNTEPPALLR